MPEGLGQDVQDLIDSTAGNKNDLTKAYIITNDVIMHIDRLVVCSPFVVGNCHTRLVVDVYWCGCTLFETKRFQKVPE